MASSSAGGRVKGASPCLTKRPSRREPWRSARSESSCPKNHSEAAPPSGTIAWLKRSWPSLGGPGERTACVVPLRPTSRARPVDRAGDRGVDTEVRSPVDALDALLTGRSVRDPVRPEILASWRRALARRLRPDRAGPLHQPGPADHAVLDRVKPVLDPLGQDLGGSGAAVVLADAHGRILARYGGGGSVGHHLDGVGAAPGYSWAEEHVGTNGIGTAIEDETATVVGAVEHFADTMSGLWSAGAPVFERRSGRLVAVVGIFGRAEDASPLLLTVACQAAREIERQRAGGK